MYAKDTTVSSERSRMEIEQTLKRYGAEAFAYGSSQLGARVEFQTNGRRIRFTLPMPDPKDEKFRYDKAGRWRHPGPRADRLAAQDYEQEVRRRWRALSLVIKAKLEAVQSNITTLEQEFMAHLVMPGGQTVGQELLPRINEICETGAVPALSWEGR